MSTFSLKLTGNDKIQVGLNTFGDALPDITNTEVEAEMELARFEASGGWTGGNTYAVPQLPNQGYERTGGYGRNTYVEQDGRSFKLISDAPWSQWVGGDREGLNQALIHAFRWPLIYDVVFKHAEALVVKLDDRIARAAEAFGL